MFKLPKLGTFNYTLAATGIVFGDTHPREKGLRRHTEKKMYQHRATFSLLKKALKDPHRSAKIIEHNLLRLIGHHNYKRFIVIARSRTGSNLLISYLDSHPNIHADREVFAKLNGRDYKSVLSRVYGKQPRKIKAAGFKIFYYHPMDENGQHIWDYLIKSEDIFVIHLKRFNILRTMISRKIAEKQDSWELKNPTVPLDKNEKCVDFTFSELENAFKKTREWEIHGDKIFEKHRLISVYYEDIVKDPENTLEKVIRFIGVDNLSLKTNLRKQNPERLRDLVTNYDELKSAFSGTEWQAFFEE